MSAAALSQPVITASPAIRVTQRRVMRSEMTKLLTLRSTYWCLAIAVVLMPAVGVLAALSTPLTPAAATWIGLDGVLAAVLPIGVLGALFMSTEYRSGQIRTTFTAVPARLPVLWAKLAVFTAVVLPVMLAASLIGVAAGSAAFASAGASLTFPAGTLAIAIAGSALFLTAVGVIGMLLGAITRSSAAAIAILFGLLYLAPTLMALAGQRAFWMKPGLLMLAGDSLTSGVDSRFAAGLACVAIYIAVMTAFAAWLIRTRDV